MYHLEVYLSDITLTENKECAVMEFRATTPDGHILSQSLNLKKGEAAFMEVGLEQEQEAIARGEAIGRMKILEELGKGWPDY